MREMCHARISGMCAREDNWPYSAATVIVEIARDTILQNVNTADLLRDALTCPRVESLKDGQQAKNSEDIRRGRREKR